MVWMTLDSTRGVRAREVPACASIIGPKRVPVDRFRVVKEPMAQGLSTLPGCGATMHHLLHRGVAWWPEQDGMRRPLV